MRQADVIAAAGIVALNTMTDRLVEDHVNAKLQAEGLNAINNILVNMETVQTNIVMIDLIGYKYTAPQLCEILAEKYGILCDDKNDMRIRMVLNRHITKENVTFIIETIKNL